MQAAHFAALDIDVKPFPGVWRGWSHNQRVVYFYVAGGKRSAMEAAITLVGDTASAWPLDKPFRVVYDVSNGTFTPHARRAAYTIYDNLPDHFVDARSAVVLPNSLIGTLFRSFTENFMRVVNPKMERRFFVDGAAALDWVAEGLDDP